MNEPFAHKTNFVCTFDGITRMDGSTTLIDVFPHKTKKKSENKHSEKQERAIGWLFLHVFGLLCGSLFGAKRSFIVIIPT
jgi:hypothetical protein